MFLEKMLIRKKIFFIRGAGDDNIFLDNKIYEVTKQKNLLLKTKLEYIFNSDILNEFDKNNIVVPIELDGSGDKKYWFNILIKYKEIIENSDLVIAYSSGVQALLNLAQENIHIKTGILLAATLKVEDSNWEEHEWNYEKIQSNINKLYIFNSPNDPYINIEDGKNVAKKLNGELFITNPLKHFGELFNTHIKISESYDLQGRLRFHNKKNYLFTDLINIISE